MAALGVTARLLASPSDNEGDLAVIVLSFSAVLFFEAWVLIRPLAVSFVQIFPNRIALDRVGKKIDLKFSDITAVRFSYIPYIGGWFSVETKTQKPYRFTVVLEQSETALDAIFAARPDVSDSKKLLRYRRTAIFADHSWARLYRKAKTWPALILKYLLFPLILAGALGLTVKKDPAAIFLGFTLVIFGLNMIFGGTLYLLEEILLGWRLRKILLHSPFSSLERSIEAEIVTQKKMQRIHYALMIAFTVLITAVLLIARFLPVKG